MVKYIDTIKDVNLAHYEYWNDLDYEKSKPFYVKSVQECKKIIDYEKNDGIYWDMLYLAKKYLTKDKKGISLGAGVCWEAGILFNEIGIKNMDFIDFSKHRIFDIAPVMLKYFEIPDDLDIRLIHGDYYHTPANDKCYDFVIMSEALMMADYPLKLLMEAQRILCDDGICIVIGEPRTDKEFVSKQKNKIARKIAEGKSVSVYQQRESLAFDISGANWYEYSTYEKMYTTTGFISIETGGGNCKFLWWALKKQR